MISCAVKKYHDISETVKWWHYHLNYISCYLIGSPLSLKGQSRECFICCSVFRAESFPIIVILLPDNLILFIIWIRPDTTSTAIITVLFYGTVPQCL